MSMPKPSEVPNKPVYRVLLNEMITLCNRGDDLCKAVEDFLKAESPAAKAEIVKAVQSWKEWRNGGI